MKSLRKIDYKINEKERNKIKEIKEGKGKEK